MWISAFALSIATFATLDNATVTTQEVPPSNAAKTCAIISIVSITMTIVSVFVHVYATKAPRAFCIAAIFVFVSTLYSIAFTTITSSFTLVYGHDSSYALAITTSCLTLLGSSMVFAFYIHWASHHAVDGTKEADKQSLTNGA